MSHRRIDSPRPERARLAKGMRPGPRENMKRRIEVEGLEPRQLLTTQVLASYPLPQLSSAPAKIALVSDGSLWFTENGNAPATLGRITTSGQLTEPATLESGDATFGLTNGPDGNLWVTEQGATPAIASVVPSATSPTVTEYTNFAPVAGLTNPSYSPNSITKGPQGDNTYLWFTDSGTNAIGRVSVTGGANQSIQEFPLPANQIVGTEIAAGPAGDDGVYFTATTEFGTASYIGKIDPNGVISEYPVANTSGVAPGAPTSLTAGPGDSVYFTEMNTGRIGQLNLSTGIVNDDFFTIPDVTIPGNSTPSQVGPTAISEFPDGSLYFTESNVGSVGRLSLTSTGTVSGFYQYTSFPAAVGSLTGIAADATGNPWFTISGGNAIGTFALPSAALQGTPVTISGTVNQPLTNITVATFTDPDGPSPSTEYQASINWGDGSPVDTDVTFAPTGSSSTFVVQGTHTYTSVGTFSPTVTITDLASPRTVTVTSTADISTVSPVTPGTVIATAGTPYLGTSPVATFPVPTGSTGTYTATVDWGDGTALGGATITGPTLINGVETDSVIATHTFATGGTFNGSVIVRNPDGTLSVSPLASTVSGLTPVYLVGAPGPEGVAGTPLTSSDFPFDLTTALGAPDPNAIYYSATINWGDGSTTAAQVVGTNNGSTLQIVPGTHTYAAPGTYSISYTLGDTGAPGLTTGTIDAVVAGLTGTPVAQSGVVGTPIGGGLPIPLETVASLPIDAAPSGGPTTPAPQSGYYSATIDYGDGSPTSTGTLVANANGTFTVEAPTHIYQSPGNFAVNILIGTTGQPNLADFTSMINVAETAIAVTGALNPASDSGISNTDGITNVTTPNFFGTTAPGATVTIYATLPGVAPIPIGQGVADASGSYSITTIPLANGVFGIDAIAVSKFGGSSAVALIEGGSHPLVIDTIGPKITDFAVTNTLKGQFQVTFQDENSGLVPADLVNGANYVIERTSPTARPAQDFIVSSLTATPETYPTEPVTVTGSVFNGHYLVLRGGVFVFTINSTGITDVAGNQLDGTFYGTFPTGNGGKGGDFKAQVIIKGYTPSGPTPFTTANPNQPGVATVSPIKLAPKLKKPGLNAPPTSLPGISKTSLVASKTAKHAKPKA